MQHGELVFVFNILFLALIVLRLLVNQFSKIANLLRPIAKSFSLVDRTQTGTGSPTETHASLLLRKVQLCITLNN
jgi:hypothetical protein